MWKKVVGQNAEREQRWAMESDPNFDVLQLTTS